MAHSCSVLRYLNPRQEIQHPVLIMGHREREERSPVWQPQEVPTTGLETLPMHTLHTEYQLPSQPEKRTDELTAETLN